MAIDELAREIYAELGEGNRESVYEAAMAVEFREQGIPYAIENNVEVLYKGHCVGTQRLDFVVDGSLAIELQAAASLTKAHVAQTRAYMRTAAFEKAMIINFPTPSKADIRS